MVAVEPPGARVTRRAALGVARRDLQPLGEAPLAALAQGRRAVRGAQAQAPRGGLRPATRRRGERPSPQPAPAATPAGSRRADPAWRATALSGLVLSARSSLALASSERDPRLVAAALAAGIVPIVVALLAPGAARALRSADGRSLLAAAALVAAPLGGLRSCAGSAS